LVCDFRRDRGGDCGGGILATQPDYGTFCASGDKSTGNYAGSSTNNAAKDGTFCASGDKSTGNYAGSSINNAAKAVT
jgi:hypothetical protein